MNSMFCPRKNVFLMKTQICEECEYCDIRLFFWRLPGIGISRRNHSICTTFIPPDVTPIIPSTVQKIQFGFLCWWFADVITILSHRYMNVYFYPARELLQTCCGFLPWVGTRFNIRWELTSSYVRLKRGRMDRTRRNGVQYGRRWSIMVDYCRQLQWFTMDGVGRQSRKVLFVCQLKISNQSREKGFFIGAGSKCAPLLRCLRLVQIHNISPLFWEMQSYSTMRIWCVQC